MNTNVTPCPPHTAGKNVWELHCTVCGIRLLEGGISIEQLVGRVESLVQEPVSASGRIRGTWVEMLEEGDGQLWAYWARPARNFAGYEAIDTTDPEPTGEQLSALLLAELAGFPAPSPEPAGYPRSTPVAVSRPRRKPSRWERFKKWCRGNAEREFVTLAMPITCIWAVALGWVLGWDGMTALAGLLVGWMF